MFISTHDADYVTPDCFSMGVGVGRWGRVGVGGWAVIPVAISTQGADDVTPD